ncbi:MAG TPA: vWA domain-containing protein [Candidatus Saccharimonadales bacterium]|nr:vWA domain-containing protein [Candidatus Saccharimonadales bacterium]
MNSRDQESWLRRWLRWLFRRQLQTQPEQPFGRRNRPQPEQPQPRYDVQSAAGRSVGGSDSLAEAHKQWQQRTQSQGRIIDTDTGEDVTPPPDDNGRYVVQQKDGTHVASFDRLPQAEDVWQDATGGQGRIIDTATGQDVTPGRKSVLNDQQIRDVLRAAGRGPRGPQAMQVDAALVARLVHKINRLPLPIFDVSNIVGKGKKIPTKTVPIKRRQVEIQKKKRMVWVEHPGPPQPDGHVEVPYPTDEPELVRMRRLGDVTRIPRSQLGQPRAVLRRRIARREPLVRIYNETVADTPTIAKRREWQEYEEPVVKEWTENIEVAEEPTAQLIEVVIDVSGSMQGTSINIAVATALTVIGGHLDDGSRYVYRQFASFVGDAVNANTPKEKRELARALMDQNNSLGGGTDILSAITAAAADVRRIAREDDRPQVLLITDGSDGVTAESVFAAVGSDVLLHAVIVNGSNMSLRQHSTTYYELRDSTVGLTNSWDY